MRRIRPDVDIIMDVLKAAAEAQPYSEFVQSLMRQYQERGGLSKKQLEGLYGKAQKVKGIPPAKLATLEAIILKKHAKTRSVLPPATPLYQKDEATAKLIGDLLDRFPAHKRVLYLKAKYDNNETLNSSEISELQKFSKLLNK